MQIKQSAPPSRKRLTPQDQKDWAELTRQVTPLPGRSRSDTPLAAADPSTLAPNGSGSRAAAPTAAGRANPQKPVALTIDIHPGGLDNATWNRFRTSRLSASRTLDLHGLTAQRAFHALQVFLHAAHADRVRCVEVITGRGSGEGRGVIRREFPLWLNLPTLRPLVLAAHYPHPANAGAVRLLLRRRR